MAPAKIVSAIWMLGLAATGCRHVDVQDDPHRFVAAASELRAIEPTVVAPSRPQPPANAEAGRRKA